MSTVIAGEVRLLEGMAFRAHSDSGFELRLDASREAGGAGAGMRPIELVLLGLGGCTGMDMIGILRKMRQEVTGYKSACAARGATRTRWSSPPSPWSTW